MFQKTGCLITADGSDDKFIQPEDLPNFAKAPLSLLDPSSGAPIMGNDAATESEKNETQEGDDFGRKEEDFEVVDQQEEGEQNILDILIGNLL